MGLERTFQALNVQLRKLHDNVVALRLTIGDKPPRNTPPLVQELGERVEILLHWLQEGAIAGSEGQRAVEPPLNIDRARQALAKCQEPLDRAARYLAFEIANREQLNDLTALGRRRGGEWSAWAPLVCKTLTECQQDCYDTNRALLLCWHDLAERSTTTAISVQATSIGQQLTAPPAAADGKSVP
jgi:hypothetical protein